MSFKKIICILLIMLMTFICGCKKNTADTSSDIPGDTQSQPQAVNTMNLLYCATDTFNPYGASTEINRELCKLIFEPLVKLDNSYNPVYALASDISIDGTKCTVTIKDAVFSDGSAVSANDVIYSFNLAKQSATVYAAQFYEVSSVTAVNTKAVVFSLVRYDPFFKNLLDFPILKANSENRANSDSVLLPPIGCGRYVVNDDRTRLELNQSYYGTKGSISTINLINAPDSESISHYVEIGVSDIYYTDIADGNIVRMSGKKEDINLNNLVYIGVNQANPLLAQPYLRYALSSAIDRSKICLNAYYNNAIAANGFFNPVWKEVSAVQNIQSKANSEITIENLEKIGYNNLDSNGYRINSAGQYLSFRLLVNSENRLRACAAQIIASQLKDVGIKVTVIEKSYEDYVASLQAGDFELYLGEINVLKNMDFSSLVIPGGSIAYGNAPSTPENPEDNAASAEEQGEETVNPDIAITSEQVIAGFYNGTNTISDVANILQTEMPVIPVCYRTGIMFYNDRIENVKSASQSDIYFSIESYTITK